MAYFAGGPVMPMRRLASGLSRGKFQLPRCASLTHIPRHAYSTLPTDIQPINIEALKVNESRLMATLHKTCEWGEGKRWGMGPHETGMSRLALSDADKHVRDWFWQAAVDTKCHVKFDHMGNMFAVRPGRRQGLATFAGSHLDTQPSGGRYDGILGVIAGIEMLRVLDENKLETEFPVGVVNWTNEEGARFPMSMMASAVWAGAVKGYDAGNLREVGGGVATVRDELKRIGYAGKFPASYKATPMAAHFELHIEQGPILEEQAQKVGVVRGVQAYRWYTVTVDGQEAHTGTTPLKNRADAMLLAAQLITHSNRLATKHSAVASTGILTLSPGSTNTIPGRVSFSLDVRAPADSTIDAMDADLKRDFEALAAGEDVGGLLSGGTPRKPLSVSFRTDSDSPATQFHPDCIEAIQTSAEAVTGSETLVRDMLSGAGHDSVYTSRHCPTGMIFVPSRDGISHNPAEYTSPEDCAIGATVLMHSVLRYDQLRVSRLSSPYFGLGSRTPT
ncbi:hypothetical protein GGR50DRAFT_322485 [Xylaria sp. CBS 124048]|nr:hypothetical protein GGR50DRAFT_322485 [Xylaria sp. CBS 124048]